jgi:putative DNA primase/helicase
LERDLNSLHDDEELPARLLRRAIDLVPITLDNIKIFAGAAARRFGNMRFGDQFGTLLAGAWSLAHSRRVTESEAEAMIDRYRRDWEDCLDTTKTEEPERALATLIERQIRIERGVASVYELICRAADKPCETSFEMKRGDADRILRHHGMAISKDKANLLINDNSAEMKRLFSGTAFEADPGGQLGRVRGAQKGDATKIGGLSCRPTRIPLELILDTVPKTPTADQRGADRREVAEDYTQPPF